jgi:microcystin-dependent protein
MSEPFLGQIELFAFDYPPRNWAVCDGSLLLIGQNQALFSLLGTTYGGDGLNNFRLPDLRGRAAMGFGQGGGLTPRSLGETAGEETVTLTVSQSVPSHAHALRGVYLSDDPAGNTNTFVPDGSVVLARSVAQDGAGKPLDMHIYAQDPTPGNIMAAASIGTTGGQPHDNLMPYLTINVCIALAGEFPPRN